MQNVAAEFKIERIKTIGVDISIGRTNPIETIFTIKASPTKVSQLENDLNFQTETQVQEMIQMATDTFVFEQGIASDTWVIEHNLNKHPSVTVVDTAGTVFTASVEYNSDNVCTVYINGATKGKAYLN